MSVAIFEVFSCTTLANGESFLDADVSVRCYDATHYRYMGAAAFWLLAVTLGIPAFFIWLCHRFHVPHMARTMINDAFLKEAVQLAWQERVPQPDVDVRELTVDSISIEHLEALYAFFVHGKSAEEAGDILAGRAPPVVRGAEEENSSSDAAKNGQQRLSFFQRAHAAVTARVAAAKAAANSALKRAASLADLAALRRTSACMHELSASAREAVERRNLVLSELLEWCKTSGELSIPPLRWSEEEDEEEEAEAAEKKDEGGSSHVRRSSSGHHCDHAARSDADAIADAAAAARGAMASRDIPAMKARALRELGFLIAAFRVDCWYWCVSWRAARLWSCHASSPRAACCLCVTHAVLRCLTLPGLRAPPAPTGRLRS